LLRQYQSVRRTATCTRILAGDNLRKVWSEAGALLQEVSNRIAGGINTVAPTARAMLRLPGPC
jgi:hypothetical protein